MRTQIFIAILSIFLSACSSQRGNITAKNQANEQEVFSFLDGQASRIR